MKLKVLIFAHVPPPHHGQSYMVKLLLDGLDGDVRRRKNPGPFPAATSIACYHVEARYSEDIADIGTFRLEKIWLVLRYCAEAIWCRLRYGVRAFYYVPAPGKRGALYRDWLVMLICRPFFRDIIHHWHAAGLGDWLEREGTPLERWLTHRLLGRPALGIALTVPGLRDALWFRSRRVAIVPNGIPDSCPDYEAAILPIRRAVRAARLKLVAGEALLAEEREFGGLDPAVLRVLFLGHCTRDKGLFDALEAIAIANQILGKAQARWRVHLTVAGQFLREDDYATFQDRIAAADLGGMVTYAGQVMGDAKTALLRASDTLCFPTFYIAESFGLVLVEAMVTGLSVVATQWRANGEVLPPGYPGLVPVGAPGRLADSILSTFTRDSTGLRTYALGHYSDHSFIRGLATALLSIETPPKIAVHAPLENAASRAPGRRRILQIFSRYEAVGGEEGSVRRIAQALSALHDVEQLFYSTDELRRQPGFRTVASVRHNRDVESSLRYLLRRERFDFWQVHNVFPAMSPAVYRLAFARGVPVVQYLHNFRFSCVNGFFLNHGELCQRCIGGNFWPAFTTACWRDSHVISGGMGLVLHEMRAEGTLERITHWIALSENHREQHVRMGIPAGRISVVPHFYTPSGPPLPPAPAGHALFVGRLSLEKGVLQLLRAWKILQPRERRLVIIGDGPEAPALRAFAARENLTNVVFTGFLSHEEQRVWMTGAAFVTVPSIWLEPFGMVVLEAWAQGRAVIAHRIGGLPEIVEDGRTGLLAEPGDPASLAGAIARLLDEPGLATALGRAGRARLETHYHRDLWLERTRRIYDSL